MSQKSAVQPMRQENYPEWYQSVVKAADLAEHSDVRGCMVIKPWGYGMWERIQAILDRRFKETGHKNAYFPLLIPVSFLEKEAQHVEGFAKECAVVTHRRLVLNDQGKLIPSNPLEEVLIIRPTSETIIGASFARWIQSYRDLPVLINQWANVMRWEMRTRLFLRTAEFLWQEGHTVHETADDAMVETKKMLDVYAEFAEGSLAMPVIRGEKTAGERFPGAVSTFCIEAMMQDKKALQAGTSHFLGQNFSKAQNIKFLGRDGKESFGWTTSWGVSTRLIGGVIMTHADDDGMVVPPRIAPTQISILPIVKKPEDEARVFAACDALCMELNAEKAFGESVTAEIDRKDIGSGEKFWNHVKRGVPLVVEMGPRDLDQGTVAVTIRNRLGEKRKSMPAKNFVSGAPRLLETLQKELFDAAEMRLNSSVKKIDSEAEFDAFFGEEKATGIEPGFVLAHCMDSGPSGKAVQDKLAAKKVSVRCIPLRGERFYAEEEGKCIFSGVKTTQRYLLGRAY